jgi:hypothetical protein
MVAQDARTGWASPRVNHPVFPALCIGLVVQLLRETVRHRSCRLSQWLKNRNLIPMPTFTAP